MPALWSRRFRQVFLLSIPFTFISLSLSRLGRLAWPWSQEKLAFATLLTSYDGHLIADEELDYYFVSARLLNYQLQHDPATRTARRIPFLVLVTTDIAPWKKAQLEHEGATVVGVDKLEAHWLQVGKTTYLTSYILT